MDFLPGWVATYRKRRDRAIELIREIPGLSCSVPDGAFYLYVNCAGLIGRTTTGGQTLTSDQDVALYFLDESGVAVIAGSSYGLAPYFRISIATGIDLIEEAFKRIAASVAKLSA